MRNSNSNRHIWVLGLVWVLSVSGCKTLPLPTQVIRKPVLAPVTHIDAPKAIGKPQGKGEKYYDPNRAGAHLYDTHGHEHKPLGKYFSVRDFSYTGDIVFRYARIDPKLTTCLNELSNQLGRRININSAYRSWGYNEQLLKEGQKASRTSFHLSGKAADVSVGNIGAKAFAKLAYTTCGCGTGLGVAGGWFHIDTRGRSVRPWGYSNTPSSKLAAVRSVHKSICGDGGNDINELGERFIRDVGSAWNKIKNTIENVIK